MNSHTEKGQVESLLGDLDAIRDKSIPIEDGMVSIDWLLDLMYARGNRLADRVEGILKASNCHPQSLKITENPSDDFFEASQALRKIVYS